jgi:predicted transcriptional regulator
LEITQSQLAKESGISQSTIAKIERGKMSASYDTVVKLFNTLEILKTKNPGNLIAADVASKNVVFVQSTDYVRDAADLMRSSGFSQLPVFNGESSVGSISERRIFDLLRDGKTMDELKDTPINSIMDESFPVINENISMSMVTSMMTDCNAILVSRKGKIIGMITNADILKLI